MPGVEPFSLLPCPRGSDSAHPFHLAGIPKSHPVFPDRQPAIGWGGLPRYASLATAALVCLYPA